VLLKPAPGHQKCCRRCSRDNETNSIQPCRSDSVALQHVLRYDDDDDDDDDCAENDNRDVGLMTECRLLVEIQYSQGCDILSACNGDPVPA